MSAATFASREPTRYAEFPSPSSTNGCTNAAGPSPSGIPSLQGDVHGLHAGVEVHGVETLLEAERGLLVPAERGLRERDRVLVDVHHPRLEAARDPERGLEVLR